MHLPRMPAVAAVAILVAATGCAHLASRPTWTTAAPVAMLPAGLGGGILGAGPSDGLPDASEVTAGQLVIHADFPVAGKHRLVRELDALRTDVSQELGLPVSDEPVHLYLFENTARYDAFVARRYPAFPARRAFFVETDTTLSVFAAWQDRIAEDLRHETTHGYVHAVVPAVPLWLDEGVAEFFETPKVDHGLHRGHVAHLAGRLLEGTWRPDIARLEAVTAAGDMSQDHYAEAWCWVHWMLRTTPERRKLLQDYLADVRRDPETPPLSVRLKHELSSGEDHGESVKAHLAALAATASTEH
jgi:hypothetical protein